MANTMPAILRSSPSLSMGTSGGEPSAILWRRPASTALPSCRHGIGPFVDVRCTTRRQESNRFSVRTVNQTHIDGAKALIRDGIDETVDKGASSGWWFGRLCERAVLRQTQTRSMYYRYRLARWRCEERLPRLASCKQSWTVPSPPHATTVRGGSSVAVRTLSSRFAATHARTFLRQRTLGRECWRSTALPHLQWGSR